MKTKEEVKQFLIDSISKSIRNLNLLIIENPKSWIVRSENHIFVGKEDGLKGTSFNIISIVSAPRAITWNSKREAEQNGIDIHLVDKDGKFIYQEAVPAVKFYQEQINVGKRLLKLLCA